MTLNLYLYDDSEQMFADLPTGQTLVVPSATVRTHLLYRLSQQTYFTKVITLYDLFQETADQLGDLPHALLPVETQGHIASLLRSDDFPEELRALRHSPAGLDSLVAHLREIDERADRDYAPTNHIEEGIVLLRERLRQSGEVPKSYLQSLTARQAKDVTLPSAPLTVLPRGQLSPMAAGLMKGLAFKNEVNLYFLSSPAQAPLLVKQGKFKAYQERFTGKDLARRSWISEHNQAETIIDIVAAWQREGVDNIGIVIDPQGGLAEQLEVEAALRRVPLMVSTRVTAKTSPLGTLLLTLAERFENDGSIIGSEEITSNQALALETSLTAGDGLRGLIALGEELVLGDDPYLEEYGRDYEWLFQLKEESLDQVVEDLSLSKVISLIRSKRSLRGRASYPTVVSYSDAGACVFDRIICASLDRYPPRTNLSPFVSQQLVDLCPLLRSADLRGEFSGALRSARQEIAFVGVKDSPAPYWGLTYEGTSEDDLPKPNRLLSHWRRRQDKAKEMLSPGRLRQWEDIGHKRNFSVSELQQFDDCPAGWFVKYILDPKTESNDKATMGSLAHNILVKAITHPNRQQFIIDSLEEAEEEMSETARRLWIDRLIKTSDLYSQPAWPLPFYRGEFNLSSSGLLPSNRDVSIHGRADRLDGDRDSGILLIDYKSGRRPNKQNKGELQQILYPLMVADQLQVEALGLLYVSLRFHGHDGLLKRKVAGIDDEHVRYSWSEEEGAVIARIERAVDRIAAGDVFQVGRNCPPWCPHWLVSQTTREVFQ